MYRETDSQIAPPAPVGAPSDLVRDLGLATVYEAMAADDPYLREVAEQVLPASLRDPEAIRYRQRILADCIAHPQIVRRLYGIAVTAIELERRVWGYTRHPGGLLHRSIDVLGMFRERMRELRAIADTHRGQFQSEGLRALLDMIAGEIDDAYLEGVTEHLRRLQWRSGLLLSARLGRGNHGAEYRIRTPFDDTRTLRERLEGWVHQWLGAEPSTLVYELDDRDESGFQALHGLSERGIAHVAGALGASTTHILEFFAALRAELGFYLGCLNLRERLAAKGEPVCFPEPDPTAVTGLLRARGLYDLSLTLSMQERVVGNDLSAGREQLLMITGANRGGKTTFLRGVGLAQLLMQCGAFVPAEEYRAGICQGVFTHFKREEDAAMRRGKLDEELARMSAIVDRLAPGSLVLLNESFASTNEREGSEIARQIVGALLARGVKVMYVTHLFDLAQSYLRAPPAPVLFLRAERLADGRRTFRLLAGEPLSTSYAMDVYARVFRESDSQQSHGRHAGEGHEQ
jgi:hypothetical protein